jgi:Domain of unknown function (DUF5597)/Beta-galactosidase
MASVKRVFKVDGKPFFPLGGEASNSSGYNDHESEVAFKAVQAIHGNTVEIPVYWEKVEPEEGQFDFSMVESLLVSARKYGIKLILLWFATWKNGNMDYAPSWVKTNPQRFKRVISPSGEDLWVLSPHCKANLAADKKAFTALCRYLKTKDEKERTVIGLQIENEPGSIGSDRDYSPEGQALFDSQVPSQFIDAMKKAGDGRVNDIWQKIGSKNSGTWFELFGWEAGEIMSAWSIANYIDDIAESGKAVFDIPMFINVWMMESGWSIPGESYPSGGAVSKVLDIYKWFTPHVDMIAPDIKPSAHKLYAEMCATYSRADNPLFMPETPPSPDMFRAIANYNLIGYMRMAGSVESFLALDGSIRPESQTGVDTIRCVASAIPLILKYQGTSKIYAVLQEEFMEEQHLDFDGYTGLVEFASRRGSFGARDWRHSTVDMFFKEPPTDPNRGRGLVFQVNRNEFYLVGINYRLRLREKPSQDKKQAPLFVKFLGRAVSLDEGHFDKQGKFVVDRPRNGDQLSSGVWMEADVGVVRLIACT